MHAHTNTLHIRLSFYFIFFSLLFEMIVVNIILLYVVGVYFHMFRCTFIVYWLWRVRTTVISTVLICYILLWSPSGMRNHIIWFLKHSSCFSSFFLLIFLFVSFFLIFCCVFFFYFKRYTSQNSIHWSWKIDLQQSRKMKGNKEWLNKEWKSMTWYLWMEEMRAREHE